MLNAEILNNEEEMVPLPTYRKGGRVNRRLQPAHFSPGELRILDHLQGGTERCKKTGMRCYNHLEEILKNPHVKRNVLQFAREHHADGNMIGDALHHETHDNGQDANMEQLIELILMKMKHDPSSLTQEELNILKSQGRDGDRELASIGPETSRLFDHMAGHRTRNPRTGLHEYWSLGGILGGLWNGIKGGASSVWDTVKKHAPGLVNSAAQAILPHTSKMATDAINSKFGADSPWAGALNNLAGLGHGLASQGINHLAGGQTSAHGQNFGDALGGALGGLAQGESAGKAFGQGLERWGDNQGGLAGEFAKNTGQHLVKGDHLGTSLKDAAKQVTGWGQNGSFLAGVNGNQVAPAALNGAAQGISALAGGANWKQALGGGVQGMAQGLGQNGFSNAINQFGRGLQNGGFRQGAMNAGQSAFQHMAPHLYHHANQHYGTQRQLADQQNADYYQQFA